MACSGKAASKAQSSAARAAGEPASPVPKARPVTESGAAVVHSPIVLVPIAASNEGITPTKSLLHPLVKRVPAPIMYGDDHEYQKAQANFRMTVHVIDCLLKDPEYAAGCHEACMRRSDSLAAAGGLDKSELVTNISTIKSLSSDAHCLWFISLLSKFSDLSESELVSIRGKDAEPLAFFVARCNTGAIDLQGNIDFSYDHRGHGVIPHREEQPDEQQASTLQDKWRDR